MTTIHAYGRFEKPADAEAFINKVRDRWRIHEKVYFRFDGLAGQMALNQTLAMGRKGAKRIIFHTFSDAGRDIPSAVRNVTNLLNRDVRVSIFDAEVDNYGDDAAHYVMRQMFNSIARAVKRYGHMHRKLGVAASRLSGAQMGRPRRFNYDAAARDKITALVADGPLTGGRIAETFGCSKSTGRWLLKEYRRENSVPK